MSPSGPAMRTSSGSTSSSRGTSNADVSAMRASPVAVSSVQTCQGSVDERRTNAAREPSADNTRSSQTPPSSECSWIAPPGPPPESRVTVLVHRPDLRPPVRRRRGELDVPMWRVDPLVPARLGIERPEPEVLARLVADHKDAAVRQPARGHVRHVLGVLGDLASLAALGIHDEQVLRGVVENAHNEEPR